MVDPTFLRKAKIYKFCILEAAVYQHNTNCYEEFHRIVFGSNYSVPKRLEELEDSEAMMISTKENKSILHKKSLTKSTKKPVNSKPRLENEYQSKIPNRTNNKLILSKSQKHRDVDQNTLNNSASLPQSELMNQSRQIIDPKTK